MQNFQETDAYQITWLIRRLFRAMGQYANSYLEEMGVSAPERAVMEFISRSHNSSVPEIARAYNVSRQHVQVSVNALTQKGLVTTEENPNHKRSPLIALSSKGRRLFKKITVRDQAAIKLLLKNVNSADRKQTRRTLETMLNNLP